MKRWIIRSFFIGLLLLCVGGWATSYASWWDIEYHDNLPTTFTWAVGSSWGRLWIIRKHDVYSYFGGYLPRELETYMSSVDVPYEIERQFEFLPHYVFGFCFNSDERLHGIAIPYWFPTTLSASLLCWVWRKTRPKAKGGAFPVEVSKPSGPP